MDLGKEDDSLLISRTNNICEFYNRILNQKVDIFNPRLSILIDSLLKEELKMREYVAKASVNINVEPSIANGFMVREDNLPISFLSKLFYKKKSSGLNLRSLAKDQKFIDECKTLAHKCFEAILLSSRESEEIEAPNENVQDEAENEEQPQQIFNDRFENILYN